MLNYHFCDLNGPSSDGKPSASTVSLSIIHGILVGGYCVDIGSSTITVGKNGKPCTSTFVGRCPDIGVPTRDMNGNGGRGVVVRSYRCNFYRNYLALNDRDICGRGVVVHQVRIADRTGGLL